MKIGKIRISLDQNPGPDCVVVRQGKIHVPPETIGDEIAQRRRFQRQYRISSVLVMIVTIATLSFIAWAAYVLGRLVWLVWLVCSK